MKKYEEKIINICNKLIKEHGLLNNSIQFNLQENKNDGEYLLQFYEEEYPHNALTCDTDGTYKPILIFKENQKGKFAGNIEITINKSQSESINIPSTIISKLKANEYNITYRFDQYDNNLFSFIEDNIIYKLKLYQSSNSFGCCSRFNECEAKHKCIHPNLLYATGCMFRRNI